MQTFLPYPSFADSAKTLDQKRLGKQRVEAYQLLLQICGLKMVDYPEWAPRLGLWRHPAGAMWVGHEIQLLEYIRAVCDEWTGRGYRDTVRDKAGLVLAIAQEPSWSDELPSWVGDPDFHRSHRSNLLSKDMDYYRDQFPEDVPAEGEDFLEYIWPVPAGEKFTEWKLYNFNRMLELKEKDPNFHPSIPEG